MIGHLELAYVTCHMRHGGDLKNPSRSQIFLRSVRADLDLIMNAERFARIDRIDRIFYCEPLYLVSVSTLLFTINVFYIVLYTVHLSSCA